MADEDCRIADVGIDLLGASMGWFRAGLKSRGLSLNSGSELGKALSLLEEVRLKARAGEIARYTSREVAQALHLKASGADFLTKALHRGSAFGLEAFDSHWKGLCSGDPVLTGPSANSTARNKSWELLLASLVAPFSSHVRGDEPDVVFGFNGRAVGLAAKVLYSSEPNKHLERIAEGARQIDCSNVDEGFVVVNLVEQFPHAEMFRNLVDGNVTTAGQAQHILNQWMWSFTAQYDLEAWGRRLKDKSKLLSVLFFLPTLLHIHERDMPLVPYYRIHFVSIVGREARASAFEFALNESCQRVLSYSVDGEVSG
jgi:hypothetical protein